MTHDHQASCSCSNIQHPTPQPTPTMRWSKTLFVLTSFSPHVVTLSTSFCFIHQFRKIDRVRTCRRDTSRLQLSSISVYDNIFTADTCLELHKLSVDHSRRCESGSIFMRHSDSNTPLTPLEKAVDSILIALNDTSPIVEYWSRSCYQHRCSRGY